MGTLAERYVIERLIGEGGFGAVYRGWDPRTERAVAIKRLHRVDDAAASERFRREARIISRLRSAYVVKLLDYGEDPPGEPFMVMSLVEGETLAQRFARGPVEPDALLRWGAQIAEALAEAHAVGAVHRDLKPANVMIESIPGRASAVARVLDFGVAGETASALNASGAIIGTARYVAPESWRGEGHGAAGDVYQLGLILHEGLTGAPTFDGTPHGLMRAHLADAPPPLTGASQALREVVAALLEKPPAARPRAEWVADALAALAQGRPLPARDTPALDPTVSASAAEVPAPAPRRAWWPVPLAVAAVGALALAFWPDPVASPPADATVDAGAVIDAAPPLDQAVDASAPIDAQLDAPAIDVLALDAAAPPPKPARAARATVEATPPDAKVQWGTRACARSPCRITGPWPQTVRVSRPGYYPKTVQVRAGETVRVRLTRTTGL